jgi:pimeloyl-ACP methyl ester carboxylesterase
MTTPGRSAHHGGVQRVGEAAMEPVTMVPLRKGVELAVSVHGGTAPAVVFLHGGLGNRFNWRSQFEGAQRQGWQAVAYDLGGHGDSSPYPRYSIGRHGRDLSRLLDQLAIRSPILCCHSYGVPIGLEWAARNAASGLILIAGGSHDLDPWWERPLMTLMALGMRQLFHQPAMQRWAQPWISAHRGPLIDRYFAENPIPTDHHSYKALEIFWNYDLFSRGEKDNLWSIPALTITGGHDPTFHFCMGEKLCSHFQHSRHLHFPGAGHIVMAEYPEAVNAAIAEWRAEISD